MIPDTFPYLNSHGLFPIPMASESFLLYAPYAKTAKRCSAERVFLWENRSLPLSAAEQDMFDAKEKFESVRFAFSEKDVSFMSILPTAACNYHCSYCYARDMHNLDTLNEAQISAALNYLLSNPDRFGFSITIIGGGEPTLHPNLIEYTVDTALSIAEKNGKGLDLTLVTNGSLITTPLAEFLKEHNVHVRVSFDLLPDIQEKQRGSFLDADSGLKLLCGTGCPLEVRTVVTPLNVRRLVETCEYLREHYPAVKTLHLDPVLSQGLFRSRDEFSAFYEDYQVSFLEAHDYCRSSGLVLESTTERMLLGGARRSYCPGEISLSPDGSLSVCHQKSTMKECQESGFYIGTITPSGDMTIDSARFDALLNFDEEDDRCSGCFLQPVCRGGCKTLNAAFSDDYKAVYCKHLRLLAIEILKKTTNNNMEIQS